MNGKVFYMHVTTRATYSDTSPACISAGTCLNFRYSSHELLKLVRGRIFYKSEDAEHHSFSIDKLWWTLVCYAIQNELMKKYSAPICGRKIYAEQISMK